MQTSPGPAAQDLATAAQLHVGLDLDNTLVDYNAVFAEVGTLLGLLPRGHDLAGKEGVKAFLLRQPNGEELWMKLQGQVYGRYMERAALCSGVDAFLTRLRVQGVRVSIVSHKTQYGHFDPARIDLWKCSLDWLDRRGFFSNGGFGLDRNDIHFLESRDEKIQRIADIGCHVFVDDLPLVLEHERFPDRVVRIWFAPEAASAPHRTLLPHCTWDAIAAAIAAHPLWCEGIRTGHDGGGAG